MFTCSACQAGTSRVLSMTFASMSYRSSSTTSILAWSSLQRSCTHPSQSCVLTQTTALCSLTSSEIWVQGRVGRRRLPAAGPDSGRWCLEEELAQPDTSVSRLLSPESPAPVPPWPLPPSDSANVAGIDFSFRLSDKATVALRWFYTQSQTPDMFVSLLPPCGQTLCYRLAAEHRDQFVLTLSISFLEAEIFGFL